MERNILVTYASKYGATKEIAEKIGEVLRQAGLQADVIPVNGIQDLNRYKAVVLGSAVYIGKWQKEAAEFLQANEKTLSGLPVWLFSSGPTGEGNPVELLDGWRLPAALQPVADRIRPRDITVFHGNINPDKVNFIEKWAVKSVVKKPFGDFRDWGSIVSWTTTIAALLKNGVQ
ncbi:MAG: flavodoxin domain-containing protein [Omnitrophica WOR_2 bacterium]